MSAAPATKAEKLAALRRVGLGVTGVACLAFAVAGMIIGAEAVRWAWITGVVGLIALVTIVLAASRAGPKAARAASDELYQRQNFRALGFGYWVTLLQFPLFGLLIALHAVSFPVAFGIMAALSSAAYLLANVWMTRGA